MTITSYVSMSTLGRELSFITALRSTATIQKRLRQQQTYTSLSGFYKEIYLKPINSMEITIM
jgi:hypothetical protein